MPVPTYDQFIEPLLRALAKHPDGLRAGEAYELVAESLGEMVDRLGQRRGRQDRGVGKNSRVQTEHRHRGG